MYLSMQNEWPNKNEWHRNQNHKHKLQIPNRFIIIQNTNVIQTQMTNPMDFSW